MLAVMRAGGAFVPLDPSHPIERLKGLADSVSAKLMLCSPSHVPKLSQVMGNLLPVDDAIVMDLTHTTSLDARASGSNAAYVIFTSGTTGKPKVSFL